MSIPYWLIHDIVSGILAWIGICKWSLKLFQNFVAGMIMHPNQIESTTAFLWNMVCDLWELIRHQKCNLQFTHRQLAY